MSVFFIGTFLHQRGPSEVAHEERVSLPVCVYYVMFYIAINLCAVPIFI